MGWMTIPDHIPSGIQLIIAIEHGHRNVSFPIYSMVIFGSYVSHYHRVYSINIPLNHYKVPLNHHKVPFNHHKFPLNHYKFPLNDYKVPETMGIFHSCSTLPEGIPSLSSVAPWKMMVIPSEGANVFISLGPWRIILWGKKSLVTWFLRQKKNTNWKDTSTMLRVISWDFFE